MDGAYAEPRKTCVFGGYLLYFCTGRRGVTHAPDTLIKGSKFRRTGSGSRAPDVTIQPPEIRKLPQHEKWEITGVSMRLTIERGALLRSLAHVQSVVERRNTIPILSNVQLEADGGQLTLTATDLDIAINETVAADVQVPGATTTAAHTFYDIVRKLPDGAQIEISQEDDASHLKLVAGRSEFTLACLPTEDFPVMAEDDLDHQFSLSIADLKRIIDKIRFAISTEETRYYLNGIYLHVVEADDTENGTAAFRAVATDGVGMAQVDLPMPDGAQGMPGVIVPRKTVTEVRKLLEDPVTEEDEDGSGVVQIALNETKIRFRVGNAVLTSKLIDGTYPDYRRVVPEGNDQILEVDGTEFAEAVDRVATISSEKSRAVKLSISKDKVVISVNSPDHGTGTEEVGAKYEGTPMEIGFNARYLLDIAAQVGGNVAQVRLAEGAPLKAALIRDTSDSSAFYVLMPMRA